MVMLRGAETASLLRQSTGLYLPRQDAATDSRLGWQACRRPLRDALL